jgi:hypothetical protein
MTRVQISHRRDEGHGLAGRAPGTNARTQVFNEINRLHRPVL